MSWRAAGSMLAGRAPWRRGGLGFEDGENVGPVGVHARGVGDEVGEEAVVAAVSRTPVEQETSPPFGFSPRPAIVKDNQACRASVLMAVWPERSMSSESLVTESQWSATGMDSLPRSQRFGRC